MGSSEELSGLKVITESAHGLMTIRGMPQKSSCLLLLLLLNSLKNIYLILICLKIDHIYSWLS